MPFSVPSWLGRCWACGETEALMSSKEREPRCCGGCPALGGGALAGLVLGDLVLTLLIALAVYCLATRCRPPPSSGDVKKPRAPEVESPYQELQGQRTEIYSDLKGPGAAGK
ncbi:TYRO protein tyrosine kinase-binding protein [Alligator mississippiensis]|uniref:TYRO protein tyrosine kinase-binding protein n=1 Tax=Alligator mississippiensis TaxID=8496 RepID=A0A151NDP4_ALLMI|nr:TYRO protein tyrosine kinase-binding protein [Alligator mississippiensis]